ncbi:hypothetical protein LL06_03290 [Hoeflea sp. BAL378]|uniref:TadE/TadG family type IV pilus assembly protein n=1 Tax=Hoeflea sp. BAL378 TaxID=1547437 RepID=UPI000512E860|nr:TadE/TadG family type IV pilus assembly protein [Hoeflea sp. BAL378]KGF70787.1 hypothetical protein LL06_03290 [Hoeflea sp. BAL378]
MTSTPTTTRIRKLLRNTDGNFAMMASILVPVIFIAGSLVLDTTNALSMKTGLQNAADSAALATTSQLAEGTITEDQAVAYATKFFTGQVSDDAQQFDGFTAVPTVKLTKTGSGAKTAWKVEVVVLASQKTTGLARFIGKDNIDVAVSATSESARDGSNPLSMMLVLDHSGSMSYASGRTKSVTVPKYCGSWWWQYECGTTTEEVDVPKIDVLKEAVANLTAHIQESDPTNEYARMGAVAYNNKTNSSDKLNLSWTKSKVTDFANALIAEGGTNSEAAMKWGFDQITDPGEVTEHFTKNKSKSPKTFIVFMTDGKNETGSDWGDDQADKKTKEHCQSAKDKKVLVFTVAFQAPQRGKNLLKACASGDSYYYDAESADELTKAFKDIGEEAVKQVTRLTN